MARPKQITDDNGNVIAILDNQGNPIPIPRELQSVAAGVARVDDTGNMYDAGGELIYKPGQWGSAGYPTAASGMGTGIDINGVSYQRIGDPNWGRPNPAIPGMENLNQYVVNDPTYGAIVPTNVLQYAAKYNTDSAFDKWMPTILGGLASLGIGGAAALQGAPSLFGSLGQGLGLTQTAYPGMTGSEFFQMGENGLSALDQMLNPVSESSVMGWEQTLPGTETLTGGGGIADTVASGAVGDPFFDAYTPIGTGGGPTGLPLPGAPGFKDLSNIGALLGVAGSAAGAAGGAPVENKDYTGGIDRRMTGTGVNDVLAGTSAAGGVSALLKQLGIDVSPSTLGLLGTGISTGLGVLGANQQNKALQSVIDSQKAVTQPFVTDALDMMMNPDKFYQRPEVTGAIDASLRGLSSKVGNPINNPGAIAQQAAYNTGLYNQALNTRLATALGGQDTLNRLQTTQALNSGNQLNAIGAGLGSMLSTAPNINNLLAQYLLGKG